MKLKIYLSLIITILFVQKINAQWTKLNEPTGGNCYTIERVGNEIWAAYTSGIYVSFNDGATWSHHPTLYNPTMDIKSIGDTVILLIQEHPSQSVYNLSSVSSYNNGSTWNAPQIVETGTDYYTWGNREIYVTDTSLVVNSNSDNFYISYNIGQSWDTLALPNNTGSGYLCGHSHSHLLALTYLPTIASYYSDNGGAVWNLLDTNFVSGTALVVESTFFIPTSYTDTSTHYFIARTSNHGITWDTVALDLFNYPLNFMSTFNNKIYISIYPYPQPPTIYESSDMGDTWVISSLPNSFNWVSDEETVLLTNWEWLVNNYQNLNRYNATSNIYYPTETGITAREVKYLRSNKGALFTKASDSLMISNDAGITWQKAPSFINPAFNFCFIGDTILGATTTVGSSSKMCYSYDNGLTWDSVQFVNGTHWKSPIGIRKINGRLYAANTNYVTYSDDWGLTWDSVSTTIDTLCVTSGTKINYFDDIEASNNNLFIYNQSYGTVAILDTTSMTWKKSACFSLPGVQFYNLYTLDNKIAFSGGGSYFKYSPDTGKTWISPPNSGWPVYKPSTVTSANGIWFAPCNGNIYYSLNLGNNWIQYPTPSQMVVSQYVEQSITSLNSILFAGGYGVWRDNDSLQIISGNVYFDNNNNGNKDVNENGIPYNLLYTLPFNVAFNADSIGNYAFLTAAIGDTLRPALPTNFCSSNPPFYLTNGAASNVDFGIYFYPGIQDLAVDITNTNHFRPGFNTNIEVTVTNYGSVALPAQVTVNLDSNLTYISSSVVPTQITGNTIYFTTDTLHILESEKITIQTETNFMVPFGTQIICDVTVNPVTGDTIPTNNYSQLMDSVVASYDPNEKSCESGSYFPITQVLNGDEIIYTIRFQNLGNIQADNIHIIDTLSELFDYSSFRIISSSHTMHYSIAGNGIVTYYFDNIFLPAAVTDEPGSHGFVKYAVKFKTTVSTGNAVDNTAYIYFDFNPAIITNTVTTLVADPPLNMNIVEIKSEAQLSIYPNPVSSILNGALVDVKISNFNLRIYNQLGQCLKTKMIDGNSFELRVSDLPNGLYFGKIFIASTNEQKSFRFMVAH